MPGATNDLKTLDEASFRTSVLIPLLKAMGYRDVEHYHGPNEQGKDVVGWKEEEDGTRAYTAVVAKKGNLNASASGDAANVATQVRQAFGSGFSNAVSGERQKAHRVVIATTGSIREEAREAIRIQLDEHHRRFIRFWDGERVRELLERYLPERSIVDDLESASAKLQKLKRFDIKPTIDKGKIRHEIQPKEDGTPIANLEFTFPESDEGKRAAEEAKRFFEEGGQVVIPGEYISRFEQHEELTRVFGNEKPAFVQIGPRVPKPPIPVSLLVDGARGPIAYEGLQLHIERSGTRRSEFTTGNEGPLNVAIVLDNQPDGSTLVHINLRFSWFGHAARATRQANRIGRATSAGAPYCIVHAETGEALTASLSLASEFPLDEDTEQYAEDLVAIEDHTGWQLSIPDRITRRDLLDASELRGVFEIGSYEEPFETWRATITPFEEIDFLQAFPAGEKRWLHMTANEFTYTILGREIELGTCFITMAVVLSKDEHDRVRSQLDEGAEEVKVVFSKAPEGEGARHTFPRFAPSEDGGPNLLDNPPQPE